MTVPPGIAGVKDLSLNEIGRYVAGSVAGPIVGERDSGTIKVQGFFLIEDLVGNRACGQRREGEVPAFHGVVVERCFRVFSCARIVAPSECIHSLPSVSSKCQCVLTRWLIGPRSILARASVILAREVA